MLTAPTFGTRNLGGRMCTGAPGSGKFWMSVSEVLAGRQEVKQGPGAGHLIIACSWAPVQVGGEQEGRWPQRYFPQGGHF